MTESRQAAYSRRQSEEGAEIGAIPPVALPDLRAACERDLVKFLVDVFPHSTGMKPFGADQLAGIKRLESCLLRGGRAAQGHPRGFVKTSISERAALWALLYGHCRFVPVFAANKPLANDIIASIKTELTENEALLGMFPEVCHLFRALEGKPQRCASQTCGGKLTHIRWTVDRVVFPTIEGSAASGAIFMARPMKNCRGIKHTTAGGEILRPDFFIIDDPQTDETAGSKEQVRKLLSTIHKTILRLGGHHKGLSGVVNCTVIQPDDVADTLLKLPSWQGVRYRMVKRWPEANDTLWQEYARIRQAFDRGDESGQQKAKKKSLAYYKKNRKAMDQGAEVSWEWCYAWAEPEQCEISAIQHAYNILFDDGAEAFASECQNEPLVRDDGSAEMLKAPQICSKVNGIAQRTVPAWAQHVVGFIDPNKPLLYWGVLAAGEGFRCSLIDYGTWPEQRRARFRMRDARPSLEDKYPQMGFEAVLRKGLEDLAETIAGVEWVREDSAAIRMSHLLVDANWGQYTDVVYEWARASQHAPIILPSHGKFLGATSPLWADRKHEAGEINGTHWRIPNVRVSKKPWRHVIFDTNWWKDFVHQRLRIAVGSPASLELFGAKEDRHELLADHLLAEKCKPVTYKGRTVNQYELPKNQPDNHWLDVLVGCCVGASRAGIALEGLRGKAAGRKVVTFAEIKKRRGT